MHESGFLTKQLTNAKALLLHEQIKRVQLNFFENVLLSCVEVHCIQLKLKLEKKNSHKSKLNYIEKKMDTDKFINAN